MKDAKMIKTDLLFLFLRYRFNSENELDVDKIPIYIF